METFLRINGFLILVYNSITDICLWLWFALVNKVFEMFLDFLFVCLTESHVAQDGLELTMY